MVASSAFAQASPFVTWDALTPDETPDTGVFKGTRLDALRSDFATRYGVDFMADQDMDIWQSTTVAQSRLQQSVTVDGYVLPLNSDGVKVTEFLLVPWMGACIHTPAPPPNQTIYVSYPDGLDLKKPFEPIRLSGVLQIQPNYHPLFWVDGSRAVPAVYALESAAVSGAPGRISATSAASVPLAARAQIWANDMFTTSMSKLASGGLSGSLFFALLLAFGYGALHTFGPGHGKTVVVSYFVGTGGSLKRGLTMGVRIAVIHVFSAVLVVFLFDFTVRQFTGAPPSDYRIVRLLSYGLIVAIGSVMLWQALKAVRIYRKQAAHTHDHHHDYHDHHHHDHGHDHHHHEHHDHHSGCAACAVAEAPKGSGWIAASVGIVPCTGALLVMLFGLANDLIWPAILMVFCISLGMAVAMSAIGIAALWGRQVAERKVGSDPERQMRFNLGTRVAGAICVLLVGLLLLSVTWFTQPIPGFGQDGFAQHQERGQSLGG